MEDRIKEMERYEDLSITIWKMLVVLGFPLAFLLCLSQYYLMATIGIIPVIIMVSFVLVFLIVLLIISKMYHRKYVKIRKELKSKIMRESHGWDDVWTRM